VASLYGYQKYDRRATAKALVSDILNEKQRYLDHDITLFGLRSGVLDVDIDALPYVEEAWRSDVHSGSRIRLLLLLRQLDPYRYDTPEFYRSVLASEPKDSETRLEAFGMLFWKTPVEQRPTLTIDAMVGARRDIQRKMAHQLDRGIGGISDPRTAFHAFQALLASEDKDLVAVGIVGLDECNLDGLSDGPRLLPKSGWAEERESFKQIAAEGPTEEAQKAAALWIR
jgi:hypothetical protein